MIYLSRFRLVLSFFALVLAVPVFAHADNLVLNGNFQSGFSNWTINAAADDPWAVITSGALRYASDGCTGQQCITGSPSEQSYLFQDLATVAGDTYTLSFEFGTSGNPMELQVLFGGAVVEDLLNIGVSALTTYTIPGLTATSSNTELRFLGRQDPGFNQLTDITVSTSAGPSPIPEPETIGMVGTGILGLLGVAKRKLLS